MNRPQTRSVTNPKSSSSRGTRHSTAKVKTPTPKGKKQVQKTVKAPAKSTPKKTPKAKKEPEKKAAKSKKEKVEKVEKKAKPGRPSQTSKAADQVAKKTADNKKSDKKNPDPVVKKKSEKRSINDSPMCKQCKKKMKPSELQQDSSEIMHQAPSLPLSPPRNSAVRNLMTDSPRLSRAVHSSPRQVDSPRRSRQTDAASIVAGAEQDLASEDRVTAPSTTKQEASESRKCATAKSEGAPTPKKKGRSQNVNN